MEMNELIKRINEIAKKKRTVGLTVDEEIEQKNYTVNIWTTSADK